ncbi:hypothetical protein TNCT_85151 [Trichonephila clavata]|uniref:Uncharacterized protein n=1 Tax=Trichonephila clavata TaxID=2740835 RepID=A0A8X6EYE4_TRICU|nr:hypothetical protein TNCT_85151 [Trichonephila clavata]
MGLHFSHIKQNFEDEKQWRSQNDKQFSGMAHKHGINKKTQKYKPLCLAEEIAIVFFSSDSAENAEFGMLGKEINVSRSCVCIL